MKTPNQIEKALTSNAAILHGFLKAPKRQQKTFSDLVAESQQVFDELRTAQGFKSSAKLLSGDISKLNKDATSILGLALLPAEHSGLANLCAFSDSCADSCVAFSGNGSFPTVYRSRLAKTELLLDYPLAFMTLLVSELFEAWNKNQNLAVRLNTYSDIRWERVAPWLFELFSGVQFYDYTKHTTKSRPADSLPQNYHLTYSISERTTATELQRNADIQRPLAVVVSIRSGKQSTTGEMRPIPKTWRGMPTVDGDSSDARWTTPQGSVVILRRKHTLAKNAPMISHAEKLENLK